MLCRQTEKYKKAISGQKSSVSPFILSFDFKFLFRFDGYLDFRRYVGKKFNFNDVISRSFDRFF